MTGDREGMGGMADMMSEMMGQAGGMGMPMMDMMSKMMPQGLRMMLSKLPKDERLEFAKEMVAAVVVQACEGLTKEEREAFLDDLVVEIRPTGEPG